LQALALVPALALAAALVFFPNLLPTFSIFNSPLSFYDQTRLAILARKGEKMDAPVLEAMGKIEGGLEFVKNTGAKLDPRELGGCLNFGDRYTEKRIVEELERTDPETAETLKQ
jgi:hypothetical protein